MASLTSSREDMPLDTMAINGTVHASLQQVTGDLCHLDAILLYTQLTIAVQHKKRKLISVKAGA